MINNFIKKISQFVPNFLRPVSISIDLGTNVTRLAVSDLGIIAQEPTILAYNQQTKEYLFFGRNAKEIIGKTPDFIKIIKPIHQAVINDFDSTLVFLDNLVKEQLYPYFKKKFFFIPFSIVYAGITNNATEIEKKALEELLVKLGFKQVMIINKSVALAAAIKNDIFAHTPILIVDFGAGLIEVAVVSGGGVIVHRVLKNGGQFFLKQIAHYLYLKYGVIIGENTAEQLLINLLNFNKEEKIQVVRGKSLETGLPKSIRVKTSDIKEALTPTIINIIDTIKEVIEFSPPEAVDEIYKNGIFFVGGLVNIKGIDNFFAENLKISVNIMEKPENALIYGLLKLSKQPMIAAKVKNLS